MTISPSHPSRPTDAGTLAHGTARPTILQAAASGTVPAETAPPREATTGANDCWPPAVRDHDLSSSPQGRSGQRQSGVAGADDSDGLDSISHRHSGPSLNGDVRVSQ